MEATQAVEASSEAEGGGMLHATNVILILIRLRPVRRYVDKM
jgi:hypothetical protein